MARWKSFTKELLASKWQAELSTNFSKESVLTIELSLQDCDDHEAILADPTKQIQLIERAENGGAYSVIDRRYSRLVRLGLRRGELKDVSIYFLDESGFIVETVAVESLVATESLPITGHEGQMIAVPVRCENPLQTNKRKNDISSQAVAWDLFLTEALSCKAI